ncbi:MAG: hypothetical protein Q9203_003579 [Teloschistes exilis]
MFAAMCQGQFKERQSSRIDLPEDNPETFELILKYLYAVNFSAYESVSTVSDNDTAVDSRADIYLVAQEFQLQDLKTLIVEKLEIFTSVKEPPIAFLSLAKRMYANTPESDQPYRQFFIENAACMEKVENPNAAAHAAVDKAFSDGGMQAIDMAAALRPNMRGIEDTRSS